MLNRENSVKWNVKIDQFHVKFIAILLTNPHPAALQTFNFSLHKFSTPNRTTFVCIAWEVFQIVERTTSCPSTHSHDRLEYDFELNGSLVEWKRIYSQRFCLLQFNDLNFFSFFPEKLKFYFCTVSVLTVFFFLIYFRSVCHSIPVCLFSVLE